MYLRIFAKELLCHVSFCVIVCFPPSVLFCRIYLFISSCFRSLLPPPWLSFPALISFTSSLLPVSSGVYIVLVFPLSFASSSFVSVLSAPFLFQVLVFVFFFFFFFCFLTPACLSSTPSLPNPCRICLLLLIDHSCTECWWVKDFLSEHCVYVVLLSPYICRHPVVISCLQGYTQDSYSCIYMPYPALRS